jgi:ACS family hexuronate transporter-like MFS transporter
MMDQSIPAVANSAAVVEAPRTNYRWRICALLFLATTVNYMDRQVLGLLAPDLQRIVGWNEIQYGYIVTVFKAAYAIGLLLAGRLMDRLGTKVGYALCVGVWSLAAMGHALASTVFGFGFARFMLGLGEAGNFPAAIKTVAEWFPKKERALATGLFNSGSNVGAIVAPLTVPWIAIHLGWRWAFLFTSLFSATWLVLWLTIYRRPDNQSGISAAELQYIHSDPREATGRVSWSRLLPHRQTWAFVIGKFLTDPVWWFFLFWLPKFFNSRYGLSLGELAPPLVVIYVMSDVGSIAGGWLSSHLIKRGWTVNRARKTTMLVCALMVVPIIFAADLANVWMAVALVSLATAAHQGWSANIFTFASDTFPQGAVGSVVGIGGFGGAVGGMCIASFTGFVLQWTGSYRPMFLIAGSVYLIALLIMHLLNPRHEPAHITPYAEVTA